VSSKSVGLTDTSAGAFVGRVWRSGVGPCVVTLRSGDVIDITSKQTPTVSALIERGDAADYAKTAKGNVIGDLETLAANSWENDHLSDNLRLLAPIDLQVIKACGVTFAQSMVERVIEERAAGDPDLAANIRQRVMAIVRDSLRNIQAGSEQAEQVKQELIAAGVWSQYLEVGIGPDAEVFTKSPVLSSVGWGADVGLHPISKWNNPEPEVVLAVSSDGRAKGAMLGNDVNLRDVEGRSALLLGKAKDNNASCALGPFIRLFDDSYSMDHVRQAQLTLTVQGTDGYHLVGYSSMAEISRDPEDLVAQTCGRHHQYPDGFVLFMGTLFAPTQDRGESGQGFTHKIGDVVTIQADGLGQLENTVKLSTDCSPWTFGITDLMKNLAGRDLL